MLYIDFGIHFLQFCLSEFENFRLEVTDNLGEMYVTTSKEKDKFNEATRVQIPALVHLTKLGYSYLGKITEDMAQNVYDPETNILTKVFEQQFKKLNPTRADEALQTLKEIKQELENDDLGRSFYLRLKKSSPIKLIDFENIDNNLFHCTGEFTCKNGQDEFRPDITLFVNGLPLVFVEVKKPNNHGGMVAESKRMNDLRFPNKKFRKFINITQLMIFSNNMEYDTMGGIVPVQGAFYCTAAKDKASFNCFREENPRGLPIAPYNQDYRYLEVNPNTEKTILSDFNCQVIKHSPEYQTNLNVNSPTNRILTSMCSPERLLFILKYGIAYVKSERETDGKLEFTDQKHIMRYQQMFAALAVRQKLSEGLNSGVIWHTQGSGKTALSYYMTQVLTDYFIKQNKVTKFYFIVDRLDLLDQAKQEFEARGLEVKTANSRSELMQQFRNNQSTEGNSGKAEITVVNIQRFAEDKEKVLVDSYSTKLQRIFIIDEAHRGYNPSGNFLANLFEADKNAIKIALTGTPLLKNERASWKIFGNYYHTYYYDKSIQDGYTLKIIREEIETSYKEKLSEIQDKLETLVNKKEIKKEHIVSHNNYVEALTEYIITDFLRFRRIKGDESLGGMIICETSEQAKKIYSCFDKVQKQLEGKLAEPTILKCGLILYDSDDKETQKKIIKDFKKNMTVDILVVFNMLLTGFDAPRLKRLYFGRKLKDHNLLQAITRVNRPYEDNHYGYIIDFADIKSNFEQTNEAYMKELNRFNDPEETGIDDTCNTFNQVIENPEDLIVQMKNFRQTLFDYSTDNVEDFCSEISTIDDKQELLKLRKTLVAARDCCNVVRTFGDEELQKAFKKMEITKISQMISEVNHCIDNINQKECFAESESTKQLINEAMLDITFKFNKVSEEEMKLIAGGVELKDKWQKTIDSFIQNIDQEDPELITLREAFMLRFKEHGFVINNVDEFIEHSKSLDEIMKKLTELQRKNSILMKKYNGDVKFARIHKRICEENVKRTKTGTHPLISEYDDTIVEILLAIKFDIDQQVFDRNDILKQDAYFEQTVMNRIKSGIDKAGISNDRSDRVFIQTRISRQYLDQYNSTYQFTR